jgi:hypothetical protein
MQRITTSTRFVDKFGPGKDGFNDGNDTTGVSSTQLDAAAFDNYQEEICNAIELAGIPLDPTDMTQLSQAIRAEIAAGATPAGTFVLRAGDTMTGPLSLIGAATGIIYSQDNNSGTPHTIAFHWGTGAGGTVNLWVDNNLIGPVAVGDYVLKAGDTMTGPLLTTSLYPCFPAAAACYIVADAGGITWNMDPGFLWSYARGGADGGNIRWVSPTGNVGLLQGGSVQATADLIAGGAVRLTGWSIGEVVPGSGFLQFSHNTTGVAEFGLNLGAIGTPTGLSEFAFSNLVAMALYAPVQGISYQITTTLNRHAFSWNGTQLGIWVNAAGVGNITPLFVADDPSIAQHATFDALAAINGIALGRFDKELPAVEVEGPNPRPNQVFTKTIDVGFLYEQDTEFAGPACLVRAIQQLTARVQVLERAA